MNDDKQLEIDVLHTRLDAANKIIAHLRQELSEAIDALNELKDKPKRVHISDDYLVGLNSYQCRNIRWLCNIIGYPANEGGVEPFTLANTGDWLGELHNLVEDGCDSSSSNLSVSDLKDRLKHYVCTSSERKLIEHFVSMRNDPYSKVDMSLVDAVIAEREKP